MSATGKATGRPFWAVYTLSDETGVRYVGVSKKPDVRLKQHIREARYGKTHRHRWIASLTNPPEMQILEWTDNWDVAERRWVAHFRTEGCELVNGNDGGTDMGKIRLDCNRYPNIRKVHRMMEGSIKVQRRLGTPESLARTQASYDRWRSALERIKDKGLLYIAEAHYAARFARHAQ